VSQLDPRGFIDDVSPNQWLTYDATTGRLLRVSLIRE
jgi:hypothetical protein